MFDGATNGAVDGRDGLAKSVVVAGGAVDRGLEVVDYEVRH